MQLSKIRIKMHLSIYYAYYICTNIIYFLSYFGLMMKVLFMSSVDLKHTNLFCDVLLIFVSLISYIISIKQSFKYNYCIIASLQWKKNKCLYNKIFLWNSFCFSMVMVMAYQHSARNICVNYCSPILYMLFSLFSFLFKYVILFG